MIESEFQEIPLTESTLARRGFSPFVQRELISVLHGTFCFPWGQKAACMKSTVTITEGESKTLKLGVSVKGVEAGVETSHTVAKEVTYELGDCDSISPVVCFADSEIGIYECAARLPGHPWRWVESEFFAGSEPVLFGNKIFNDLLCNCRVPPSGAPEEGVADALETRLSKVIRTLELGGEAAGVERQDPEEVRRAAALVLEDALAPNVELPQGDAYRAGLVSTDATTRWLVGAEDERSLTLVATDCNALLRGRLAINRERLVPFLAFGVDPEAEVGRVTVAAALPGRRDLEVLLAEDVGILRERLVTLWFEADLSQLPEGSAGYIDLELTDASRNPTGTAVQVPFMIETEPVEIRSVVPA